MPRFGARRAPLAALSALVALLAGAFLRAAAVSKSAARIEGRFILVAQTEEARLATLDSGRRCPSSVTHRVVDTYRGVFRAQPDAATDAVLFSNLNVSGNACASTTPQDSLTVLRDLPQSPAGTPVELAQMFFLHGTDNSPRRCGTYSAALPAFHYFTDEMPLFQERMQREGLLPPGDTILPNTSDSTIFMLSRPYVKVDGSVVDNAVCTFMAESTPTPSPSPEEEEPEATPITESSDDGGSVCFPADASVKVAVPRVPGGTLYGPLLYERTFVTKRMDDLKICDAVAARNNTFSEVYFFSHRDPGPETLFVVLTTGVTEGTCSNVSLSSETCSDRTSSVSLSPDHYIWTVPRGLLRADDVRPFKDSLITEESQLATVTGKDYRMARGLYAPHTFSGSLFVDGFLVSCYTAAIPPHVASALLAPLRVLYRYFGLAVEDILDHGSLVGRPAVVRIRNHCALFKTGILRRLLCRYLLLPSEAR